MKNILILIFLSYGYSYGQTYTYQPMNLDTSSFWVHQYFFYNGGLTECIGEKVTIVEKDTIIGANSFFKLRTYTSNITTSTPKNVCDNMYFKFDLVSFIREDTLLHRILDSYGNTVIDFDENIGDTLDIGLHNYNPIVDSITINSFNSINRKVQWGQFGLGYIYNTIEGIGANFSFPIRQYGEWHIPTYTLKCYSKNGQILFPDNPLDSCIKNPKIAVGIEDHKMSEIKYLFVNRRFQVLDSPEFPIKFSLYDITGKMLYKTVIEKPKYVDVPDFVMTGSYILSLGNSKSIFNKLVMIE